MDKETKSSSCPYCSNTEETDRMVFIFECNDQETARKALGQASGFESADPGAEKARKRRIEKADPYSTMIYKYEHASNLDEKMFILAKGLTKVKGTFTLDDVREIVGERNAEKYVAAMLERCYIIEVGLGRYRSSRSLRRGNVVALDTVHLQDLPDDRRQSGEQALAEVVRPKSDHRDQDHEHHEQAFGEEHHCHEHVECGKGYGALEHELHREVPGDALSHVGAA